mgnify:CR=1 FL=1
MTDPEITVHECSYSDVDDLKNVGRLINAYIEDEMGGGEMLNGIQSLRLVNEHPKSIVLLAEQNGQCCGLLIAFENIATFTATPMINIHDIIVLKTCRQKGVGKSLMEALFSIAQQRQCSRITLEVREDNKVAQRLYEKMGFGATEPPMLYWRKNNI